MFSDRCCRSMGGRSKRRSPPVWTILVFPYRRLLLSTAERAVGAGSGPQLAGRDRRTPLAAGRLLRRSDNCGIAQGRAAAIGST
jgi:hypothetical protein